MKTQWPPQTDPGSIPDLDPEVVDGARVAPRSPSDKLAEFAGYSRCFRSAGRFSVVGFGPALAAKPLRTYQNSVQNCPGRRPRQSGAGFWSVSVSFAAETDPKSARQPGPGTGRSTKQPKVEAA